MLVPNIIVYILFCGHTTLLEYCGCMLTGCLVLFQVMHIAAAVEINSKFIPSLKQLHSSLHAKVKIVFVSL